MSEPTTVPELAAGAARHGRVIELLNHYTRAVLAEAERVRLPERWRISVSASSDLVLAHRDEPHWVALRMFYVLEAPLWRWDHGSMGAPHGLLSTTWGELQAAVDWYTTDGIAAARRGGTVTDENIR